MIMHHVAREAAGRGDGRWRCLVPRLRAKTDTNKDTGEEGDRQATMTMTRCKKGLGESNHGKGAGDPEG